RLDAAADTYLPESSAIPRRRNRERGNGDNSRGRAARRADRQIGLNPARGTAMIDADTPLLTTPDTAQLYRDALEMLNRGGVPYLVGGTYAFQYYAGICRTTKDFDIFARPRDVRRVLDVLTRCGFRTEIAFHHWLAKAHHGDKFIDVIFNSGNGVAEVDDEWFAHAVDETVLGVPVKLV